MLLKAIDYNFIYDIIALTLSMTCVFQKTFITTPRRDIGNNRGGDGGV